MLFIAYSTLFSCFRKLDLMCEYHQCRDGQRGPIWVCHANGPVSWKDLVNILPRSWRDHGKVVFPCYTVVVSFPMD